METGHEVGESGGGRRKKEGREERGRGESEEGRGEGKPMIHTVSVMQVDRSFPSLFLKT